MNHPGHEVTGVYELAASVQVPACNFSQACLSRPRRHEDPKESALVACRCSRSPALETGLCEDTWTLDMMSISCGGHAGASKPGGGSFWVFFMVFLVFFMVFGSVGAQVSQSVGQSVSQPVGQPTERSGSQSVGRPAAAVRQSVWHNLWWTGIAK